MSVKKGSRFLFNAANVFFYFKDKSGV